MSASAPDRSRADDGAVCRPAVQVLRFRVGDAAQVSALISRSMNAAVAHAQKTKGNGAKLRRVSPESLIEDSRIGLVLVAVSSDHIVGTGTLIGHWVYNVFVEPAAWRRGTGGQIMHAIETYARHAHARAIGLFSSPFAVEFYQARGFWRHRSLILHHQEVVEMYKDLAKIELRVA